MLPIPNTALHAIVGMKGILKKILTFYDTTQTFKSLNAGSSLVQRSQIARVEPFSIIDSALRTNEALPDLQQVNLAMFAGFYVQAIALANANADFRVDEHLEPFNPEVSPRKKINREIHRFVNNLDSLESYQEGINPFTFEKIPAPSLEERNISLEEVDISEGLKDLKDGGQSLAVGKIVNITFKKDVKLQEKLVTKELTIPIGIRLNGSFLPSYTLVDILSFGKFSIDTISRNLELSTGQLDTIKDGWLLADVYDKVRKNLVKDKTGFFKAMLSRRNDSFLMKLFSNGRNQYGGISSIVVLSANTFRSLENKLEIKLSQFRQRNPFLDSTGIMILAVVDEDYRMVKYFFHSIEKPMELSFADLKKPKKDGLNMNDIVTALSMGNVPRL